MADTRTFGTLFESLVVRDLRIYAQSLGGEVFHYRVSKGLEVDAVVHLHDGRWGAVEVKLGMHRADEGAKNLLRLRNRIDLGRMNPPSFLAVIVSSGYAYTREDGVHVIPIGCLKNRLIINDSSMEESMVSLKTDIGSLSLNKPGMVASGIMDETGKSMVRMLECGCGAVVTKSIGVHPNPGHGNPCFTEVSGGYVNAMGLPNPGIDLFGEEMEIAVKSGKVVGSVYGAGPEDFACLSGKMEEYGACAVELNLSCPHAKGYGMEVGTDPETVKSIVKAVSESVSIPVWAKLTPNTHCLQDIGIAVQDAGGDAVVAINTLKAMVIVPEFARPLLSNLFGGLSGTAIRPVGVRAVYDLFSVLDIPIIGVGGISDWRSAAEYIMAGACAFQVGSAVASEGPEVFSQINDGLAEFMKNYGYDTIESMVGAAHDRSRYSH